MPNQSEIMEKKSGGGALALFGVPFLLMGLGACYAALSGNMKTESGEPMAPLVGVLISSIFILVGGALVFGRGGTVINRRRETVTTWWGLMVPFRRKVRRLEKFKYVALTREIVRSKDSSRTVFPVRIVGGDDKVSWESASTQVKGRAAAEALAKFLGFDLHDSSARKGGETVIRESEHLDESVSDRAHRLGEQVDWPELPEESKIEYETVGDSAIIRLPKPSTYVAATIMAIPALIAIGLFLFFLVFSFAVSLFSGFGLLFLIAPVIVIALVITRIGGQDTIKISWEGIEVERKYTMGGRKWKIPAEELEELEIGGLGPSVESMSPQARQMVQAFSFLSKRAGIHVRSDKQSVSLGGGLSAEEQKWLHGAIKYILVNKPR